MKKEKIQLKPGENEKQTYLEHGTILHSPLLPFKTRLPSHAIIEPESSMTKKR